MNQTKTNLDALVGSNVAALQKEQRDYERAITQRQLALSERQTDISAAKATTADNSSESKAATKMKDQFVSSLKDSDYNSDMLQKLAAGIEYGVIDRAEAGYYMGLYAKDYVGDKALSEAIADGADRDTTVTEERFMAAKAAHESWAEQYATYSNYLFAMVINGRGLSFALYGIDGFDTENQSNLSFSGLREAIAGGLAFGR